MERLRHRADFLAAAKGARATAPAFVLQAAKRREDAKVRVGFTVSRSVGNAVVRNRVRRRLREMVRLAPPSSLRPGHDYVLIGRPAALRQPFAQMAEDFARALRRVHAAPAAARRAGGNTSGTPDTATRR